MITKAHLAAMAAFTMWGTLPLYWKWLDEVSTLDIFGHRIIWSVFTLLIILGFKKKLGVIKEIWSNHRSRYLLILSAILISSNWFIYMYAVHAHKVLEASMGYFLNPIINVFLGWLILKEKIRLTQWPSIILAIIAILLIAFNTGFENFPWVAISLSLTFAAYGLVRKIVHVASLEGLAFETLVIISPVLWYWLQQSSGPISSIEALPPYKILGLMMCGVVTCVPLVLFGYAAKRLPFGTLGFLSYLSPSFKFLCGLLAFHELLTPERLQAFGIIWIALILYTIEAFVNQRKMKRLVNT